MVSWLISCDMRFENCMGLSVSHLTVMPPIRLEKDVASGSLTGFIALLRITLLLETVRLRSSESKTSPPALL